MNTFINIQQEFGSLSNRMKLRWMDRNDDERAQIIDGLVQIGQKFGINKIITMRGNREQFQVKFLSNYFGEQVKRASRSYVSNPNHA